MCTSGENTCWPSESTKSSFCGTAPPLTAETNGQSARRQRRFEQHWILAGFHPARAQRRAPPATRPTSAALSKSCGWRALLYQ